MLNYTQNVWRQSPKTKLAVGDPIASGSFVKTINVDTYYVSYRYAGCGVIAYEYHRVTNWKQVGEFAYGVVVILGVTYIVIQTGGAAAPVLAPLLLN